MKTVLCFGDSNTWGYDPASAGLPWPRRHAIEKRWTGVLAQQLGADWRVIEEGMNGRTTVHDDPMVPGRNGKVALEILLETHKPVDVVVVMLGTNDLKTLFNAPAGEIAAGVGVLARMVLNSVAGPGDLPPKLLLVCPPPLGDFSGLPDLAEKFANGREKSLALPPCYETLAAQLGCAFLNTQDFAVPCEADKIHLEASEHEKIGNAVAEKLQPF